MVALVPLANAAVPGGAPIAGLSFTATVKNRSDNQVATQIGFPPITAGNAGWVIADQYVEIDSVMTLGNGFIRTFTDNTASNANPRYTGPNGNGATPAGLINSQDTRQKLPTAWCVRDLLAAGPNPAGDPNTTFVWFYHIDAAQSDFLDPLTLDYENVLAPGPSIHYAQGAVYPNPFAYGFALTPNFWYLEANFSGALGGVLYQTNQIVFESYTL